MKTTIRVRAWHVIILTVVATLIVASTLAIAASDAAKTPVNAGVPRASAFQQPIPAYQSYEGPATVDHTVAAFTPQVVTAELIASDQAGVRFAPERPAFMPQVFAWQYWSWYGWWYSSLRSGTQVWVIPADENYHYVWHRNTWYAIETKNLAIGYEALAIAT